MPDLVLHMDGKEGKKKKKRKKGEKKTHKALHEGSEDTTKE